MKKSIIIGIVVVIILLGIGSYFYFSSSSDKPKQLVGDEVLEVKLTIDNGEPLGNIEVDLWKAGSKGIPNAGYNFTNDEGGVIFHIPEGEYEIGFNMNNFPNNLVYPEKTYILVEKGIPTSKTIVIGVKHEE